MKSRLLVPLSAAARLAHVWPLIDECLERRARLDWTSDAPGTQSYLRKYGLPWAGEK